ncbi:MAG TPA: aminotransferase class V-fold PLP-dependent enzyme [Ktedonobacterales bacterium]
MDAQHPSYGTGAATVLAPDLGSRLQELVAAWRGAERGQPLDDLHRECSSAAGPGGRAILPGYLLLVEGLTAYKVRPASDAAPGRWETGTQNHECLAGLVGTLDYLAALGRQSLDRFAARFPGMSGRRLELHVALAAIQEHERTLAERLLAGLQTVPGARIYGLTALEDLPRRVPTVAVTIAGHTPRALATALGERGMFAWDGNYYALALMERLGLEASGGALRLGLAHYNTIEEVDRVVAALRELVAS